MRHLQAIPSKSTMVQMSRKMRQKFDFFPWEKERASERASERSGLQDGSGRAAKQMDLASQFLAIQNHNAECRIHFPWKTRANVMSADRREMSKKRKEGLKDEILAIFLEICSRFSRD